MQVDDLYEINDMVSHYAANAGIVWESEEQEDEALNEATHAIAAILEKLKGGV
jgi:hypothetical protein